jgi:5-methylcytosine-specific restriction endonuclease McrA
MRGKANDMHGYALECPECGRFARWSGKQKPVKANGKRTLSTNWPVSRLGIHYCQLCNRNRKQLGKGEALEAHHVIEIESGGKDTPDNIWVVCTACHKHIHHVRTYYHEHLKGFFAAKEAYERFKRLYPGEYQRLKKSFEKDED